MFPLKGGDMALPHPLVLLHHPLILKFILKNDTDWTMLTKHHVPWMHSSTLNIYPEENTDQAYITWGWSTFSNVQANLTLYFLICYTYWFVGSLVIGMYEVLTATKYEWPWVPHSGVETANHTGHCPIKLVDWNQPVYKVYGSRTRVVKIGNNVR